MRSAPVDGLIVTDDSLFESIQEPLIATKADLQQHDSLPLRISFLLVVGKIEKTLLNHLVGTGEQRQRDGKPECSRRLQIYDQIKFSR